MLLAIPKPLFLGTAWIINKLNIQIVRKYPCFVEDSMVRVYLFSPKPENRFFKKAMRFLFRLCMSAIITYLFALFIIEQAFSERGYVAYGGELLFIPVVFLIIFKFLGRK